MRVVTITYATYRGIAANVKSPFSQAGTRRPDGTWEVLLYEDTWQALQQLRLRSETDDEALRRINRRQRCRYETSTGPGTPRHAARPAT